MKKKLQIFISSTFTDLTNERQAAVEAVLRAGNIPAGMELFSAGNKSQLDTIKKWIAQSDIYMLILGGRYGSIDSESQLSYTEVEYRYAIELEKPLFAVVLNDDMLKKKAQNASDPKNIYEFDNQEKYKSFKKLVLSKVCRISKDASEIKLAILESIIDIQNEFALVGWIKGDEIPDNSQLSTELEFVRAERDDLQQKVLNLESLTKKVSKNKSIGDYSFDEVYKVLSAKKITVPGSILSSEKDVVSNTLLLLIAFTPNLTMGVTATLSNDTQKFLTNNLVPILLNFGLVERQKARNTSIKIEYDKFILSPLGNRFLSLYQIENAPSKK